MIEKYDVSETFSAITQHKCAIYETIYPFFVNDEIIVQNNTMRIQTVNTNIYYHKLFSDFNAIVFCPISLILF